MPTAHVCVSIQSRLPPVDRIGPLSAFPSCKLDVGYKPMCLAVGPEDIYMVRRSYRCVPVGRLVASSTFWPTGPGKIAHGCVSIQSRLPPVDRIVPLQASLSCNYNVVL